MTKGGVMFFPTRVTWLSKRGKNRLVLCIEDVLKIEPPVKKGFSNLSAEEISHLDLKKDSKYTQKVNVCLCLDQAVFIRVFFSLNQIFFFRFGVYLLKNFVFSVLLVALI